MNFNRLLKGTNKPKILELSFSDNRKAKQVASHKILRVDDALFYRKDVVEVLTKRLIDAQVKDGTLIVAKPSKNETDAG